MFRCDFSGEQSKPADWSWVRPVEMDRNGNKAYGMPVKKIVTPAETPVRVVVAERSMTYFGEHGEVIGHGTEIVKVLTIRAKHLEAVKEKYGKVVRQV